MLTMTNSVMRIGVGIDTARYGHRVNYLRDDRQLAAKPVTITEDRDGYDRLQNDLQLLHRKHPEATLHVHIDAAGQYAANLERFLRTMELPIIVSVGEPKRNKDYHAAISPKRTTDNTESLAMARFALVEQPPATPDVPQAFILLREIAARLHGQIKDKTRAINRLHNLVSRVFPELATIAPNLDAAWVLDLLEHYSSPKRISAARLDSLKKIAYMKSDIAKELHEAAARSVASFSGEFAERLIRELIRDIRQCQTGEKTLEKMLSEAFEGLPESGHRQIITIPGIGPGTAAVLVAKMVSIERFTAPEKIVGYFGIFPEERSSGVDRKGRHIPPGTMVMSHKGCDLVRRYLWNAAKSAIVHNPPVRELYKRLCDRGIRGDIALGHCMQKLLHQVFAVWSTDRPFDPDYRSKRSQQTMSVAAGKEVHSTIKLADSDSGNVIDCTSTKTETTAGHNPDLSPDQSVVTTVASQLEPVGNSCTIQTPNVTPGTHQCAIDFSFVREQVNFDQVLNHLGIRDQFKGRTQLRGPCPLCQKNSSRTLSVNLQKNAYKCFNPKCSQGNVLDFWRALQDLSLVDAAQHLVQTFHLRTRRES